jgi:hypothetical protein
MKAEDLMIGDLVLYNETHQQILEISGIDDEVYLETDELVHQSEIQPISLTSEILEKNGFRKSVSPPGIHAKCYEINNKDEKYCLTIANYNKYKRLLLDIDSEDSECFNIKCDYVHQLQHALRLCGIEKEIEL